MGKVPVTSSVSVTLRVTGRKHLKISIELILVKVVVGMASVRVIVERLALDEGPKRVTVVVVMEKTVGPPERKLKVVPTAPSSVTVLMKTWSKDVTVSGIVSVAVRVVLAVLVWAMVEMNWTGLVTVKLM